MALLCCRHAIRSVWPRRKTWQRSVLYVQQGWSEQRRCVCVCVCGVRVCKFACMCGCACVIAGSHLSVCHALLPPTLTVDWWTCR